MKPWMRLCLVAAVAVTLTATGATTSLAQEPAARRSPPITVPTGPTPSKSENLDSIQGRARAAAAKVNVKDPASVKRANAELSRVHAHLTAYARANGIKLTTQTVTATATAQEQSCPGTKTIAGMTCTLTNASVVNGKLICDYDCFPQPQKSKGY